MWSSEPDDSSAGPRFLGPAEVRPLAAALGLRPTKQRGQNFVIDANTVRRIVRDAGVDGRRRGARGRPGARLADPGPARRSRVGSSRSRSTPRSPAALPATVAAYAPGQADRFEVVRGRRAAGRRRCPARRRPRWSRTCPTTSPCRCCCTCWRCCPSLRARSGDGAGRGRRPAGGAARLADLRRAVGQGRLVRRRTTGRLGEPLRLLAGAQRRLGAGRVDAPRAAVDPRQPRAGLRRRRRGVRPAPQDAAAQRCVRSPGPPRRPRPRFARAGVDPMARGESLDVRAVRPHRRGDLSR